jgi:hypothetical protein
LLLLASLIPNLGYLSEAAAFLLDQRLGLNIVPRTNVVQLASPSFHYGKTKRKRMLRENNEEGMSSIGDGQHGYLPEKVGSFQLFLDGYEDASKFFSNYPWTDQDEDTTLLDNEQSTTRNNTRTFRWTPAIRKQFQEEFEKLVVLDYLMRNTGMHHYHYYYYH